MVNLGFNFSSLLGALEVLGAIGYLILSIIQISKGVKNSTSPLKTILRVWELLLCPLSLFISGVILFFNGWRLDPILQFQQFLLHLILVVALFREVKYLIRPRR